MNEITFSPFPVLITERLILRQLIETDDSVLFSLRNDERVNLYINRPKQNFIEDTQAYIKKINAGIRDNKSIYWVICLKDTKQLIGTICLWNFSDDKSVAELGYELNPNWHGKGIMREVFVSVLAFGFNTINLQVIEAFTHKENASSIKLLSTFNFERDFDRHDDDNVNNAVFFLKRKD